MYLMDRSFLFRVEGQYRQLRGLEVATCEGGKWCQVVERRICSLVSANEAILGSAKIGAPRIEFLGFVSCSITAITP